jgi:hypothetical protein
VTSLRDVEVGASPTAPVEDHAPRGFRDAVADDLRGSSWRQRFLLVVAVGWITYEWGLGNETVTPWLLSWVVSEHEGWSTIVVAGAVGFGFTLVQQLASGFSVLAGFSIFDRSAQAAWTRLSRRVDPERLRWDDASLGYRIIIVFTLGTTVVALLQIISSGQVGVVRHRVAVVQAALLCACAVGVLGCAAGAIGHAGRSIDVLSAPTDWVLRVLGNPLFWIGVLGIFMLSQRVARTDSTVAATGAQEAP